MICFNLKFLIYQKKKKKKFLNTDFAQGDFNSWYLDERIKKTKQEVKRKYRNNQVSDAGTTNEKTERQPKALLHPDPPLSAAACGALKVKVCVSVCVCVCLYVCWGGGEMQEQK